MHDCTFCRVQHVFMHEGGHITYIEHFNTEEHKYLKTKNKLFPKRFGQKHKNRIIDPIILSLPKTT